MHLIEALLRVEDEKVLRDLEVILTTKTPASPVPQKSFKDFAGIWTEEEADKMKKDIEEACGQIYPSDWK